MTRKSSAIFYFFISCVLVYYRSTAQDLMCCSHTTGSCKSVCEKISLARLAADGRLRNQTIQEVQKFCSLQLSTFWECLNATFKDMSRGESWSGRVCCPIPQSTSCRKACITATSESDLHQGCRQSDEIDFFSCLERQKTGKSCCSNARTEDCNEVCLEIFKSRWTPNSDLRLKVQEICGKSSPKVMECVKDFITVTPAKNLHKKMHCCDKTNQSKCRESCKKLVATNNITFQEAIDGLQMGGCGTPLPQEYFWSCFMEPTDVATSVEVSRIKKVGIDSAKWHCCQRAFSRPCQKLCHKTFSKYWLVSGEEFHDKCFRQVSEENLRNCIDEVDQPCELGCDGLSFCTNFNNRPTELFRSCNIEADEAARREVARWQYHNQVELPGLVLPLKNISQCSPNIWKTVACTSQIKPCSRHSHANQICRDVCLSIVSKCVDWSLMSPEYSVESICASLSPEDPSVSCIRLQKFFYPSEHNYQRINEQVFSPCKRNPCQSHEICLLNKNCIHGGNCQPYTCVPGCKLGEVSEYMVPDGTYVRIPIHDNKSKDCLKICKCNKGKIEQCQPLLCVGLIPCLETDYQAQHGTSFAMDCKTCSCFAGEVICSKKQCKSTALTGENTAYTTLPCNCLPHYVPVCGKDGNNYPSACLAKCAGLSDSDIDPAPCEDPCRSHSCPVGHKCVPRPQICLFSMERHRECRQYECVNGSTNCGDLSRSPVCSVNNTEYDNTCALAHHNAKLAYHGPCLRNCRLEGVVCGINGRTYISECAAWSDMVSVDYVGRCKVVGLIGDTKSRQCSDVKCAPLPDPTCLGITPPGACCPICGGALKLLFSKNQIHRALYVLKDSDTTPLTLRAMLKALDRQIQVAQCVLRGYLTVEMDIFVAVQTTEKYPSALQLEACVREAEKIASLIKIQSPRIVSELSLSSITLATVVQVSCASCSQLTQLLLALLLLLKLL